MSLMKATSVEERRVALVLLFVGFFIVFFTIVSQSVDDQREETLRKCLEMTQDVVACQLLTR